MRLFAILVLLITLLIVPCSAQNLIEIEEVTASVAYEKVFPGLSEGQTLRLTYHLPFILENVDFGSDLIIQTNASTASTTVNVYVNGMLVIENETLTGGYAYSLDPLGEYEMAGGDMNVTVLDIVLEVVANSTDWEKIYIYNDHDTDPVVANFSYTVEEIIISKPKVTFYEEDSFYTVKQIINITQDSDLPSLEDVTVTFTYPENALNKPVTSCYFDYLNVSENYTVEITFQKRGPYVGEVKHTISSNGNHITTIKIYSPENLTAEMVIDPEKRPWSKYFPEFGEIVEVRLNGEKIEYETGSIEMSLDLNKGWNVLEVEYRPITTEEIVYVPAVFEEKKPWWEQEALGVPAWLWITAVLILVIGIIVRMRR